MYDDLISSLRICGRINSANDNCIAFHDGSCEAEPVCMYELMGKAADAIENTSKAYNMMAEAYEAEVTRQRWIPVTKRLPENGVHVLLSCKCGLGAYVCDGFHTEKYSTPTQFYEDIDADYDEETDEYYFPEGWWEVIKNWDEYSCVAIEDTVTHWMSLPEPPKEDK